MLSEKQRRICELALENLEKRKRQLDQAISEFNAALQQEGQEKVAVTAPVNASMDAPVAKKRKRARFTLEERLRRAERKKAYWENWRNQRAGQK